MKEKEMLLSENALKIKCKIEEKAKNVIANMCYISPDLEWSGIMLYKTLGHISNPKNLVFEIKDIIPMNIGIKTYTSYEFNKNKNIPGVVNNTEKYADKHIDYIMQYPEAADWDIGNIHSHNTFDVFFSAEDMKDLETNCKSTNYYFSLIVNNRGDLKGKVSILAKGSSETTINYYATSPDGVDYIISKEKVRFIKEKTFIYDCEIDNLQLNRSVSGDFNEHLYEIIKQNLRQQSREIKDNIYEKVSPKNTVNSHRDIFNELDLFKEDLDKPTLYDKIDAAEKIFKILFEKFYGLKSLSEDNFINFLQSITSGHIAVGHYSTKDITPYFVENIDKIVNEFIETSLVEETEETVIIILIFVVKYCSQYSLIDINVAMKHIYNLDIFN